MQHGNTTRLKEYGYQVQFLWMMTCSLHSSEVVQVNHLNGTCMDPDRKLDVIKVKEKPEVEPQNDKTIDHNPNNPV
jgi:hypothetical protein